MPTVNGLRPSKPPVAALNDQLTIVIVALLGDESLKSLVKMVKALGLHHVIVHRDGSVEDAQGLHAGISARDVPTRRRCGAMACSTAYVAFIEDTAVPLPGWSARIASALSEHGVGAVGGPVSISSALPPKTRALALTEFGPFQKHRFARLATGRVTSGGQPIVPKLPGVNFAFRRELLLASMTQEEGLVDQQIFSRLRTDGWSLAYEVTMAVSYTNPHIEGARLSTRFHHGWIYSAQRLCGANAARRAAGALRCTLVAFVLSARTFADADRSQRQSACTMAWAALHHIAWALGETMGAFFGRPRSGYGRWT